MQPFRYVRPADEAAALKEAAAPGAAFIGGGTLLVDLMKLGVATPATVVDLTGLGPALAEIKEVQGGGAKPGLTIGALARNSDVAYHPAVRERYPALAQALLSGASPQVRNMATVGGNLMQRTRCAYFRDVGVRECNKRAPGSGCAAQAEGAWSRMQAVLGGSARCIAVHPSDMCVALAALDAVVHTAGRGGARAIPVADFHTLPGEHPEVETALRPGELITHVTIPASPFAARSRYVKVRDRASFAFALASAAVALEMHGERVGAVRIALGGVATKPWRARAAEAALAGGTLAPAELRHAAEVALAGAVPRGDNAFKPELARRTIVHALQLARAS